MSTQAPGGPLVRSYENKESNPSGDPIQVRARQAPVQRDTLHPAEGAAKPQAEGSCCFSCIGSFFVSCWDVIASFFGWIGSCFASSAVDPAIEQGKMAARFALIEEIEAFADKWAWDKRQPVEDTALWLADVNALSDAAKEVALGCIKSHYVWMRDLSPEEANRRALEMLTDVENGRISAYHSLIVRKNDTPNTQYDHLGWWVEKECLDFVFEFTGPFLAKWGNVSISGTLADWQKELEILLDFECIETALNDGYQRQNLDMPWVWTWDKEWPQRKQEIKDLVLPNVRSKLVLESFSRWFEMQQQARAEEAKAAAERKA